MTRPGVEEEGTTAWISLGETTLKLVAAVVPKSTAEALVKLVPVMVMLEPPLREPEAGLMEVIEGRVRVAEEEGDERRTEEALGGLTVENLTPGYSI